MLDRIKMRWRALFRKAELEHQLDDELRFHLEQQAARNLRDGMTQDDARYSALKSFGPIERSKEESRDARGVRLIEDLLQDLRYGARLLAKNLGVSLIAIVTLALGIGATTAIFTVVNAFLWRPLPYGDPDRLVMVDSQHRDQSIGVSFADYEDWKRQNNVFEELAFFNLRWNANLEFGNETETLNLTFGTANLFSTLQVAPFLGHGPTAADSDTVLLSHGLWQRRFGSDPAIVGRQLRIDGHGLTVIGVMPPAFRFPFQSDLWWLNDRYFNRENRGMRIDQTIGRLKPGISREQAQAEMREIAARLAQAYPDTNSEVGATVISLRDFWFGKLRRSFWLLLGACAFVLLIACANVSNLLITQATVRERELAVRAALGASRRRLARQALSEAFLLVSIGAAGGLAFGIWSLRMLVALLPAELLPFFVKMELDGRALAFALLVSVLTCLLVGLVPALRTGSVDLDQSLKEGGRSGTGAGMQRIRGLLVITEIALAVVLLAGAGLMLRSFARLQNTSPGFTAENLLHLEINPTYQRPEDYRVEFMSRHYQRLLERVAQVPGVIAVAANSDLPFVGQKPWYRGEFSIKGQPPEEENQNPLVNYQAVSPDYFRVMQIPLLRGRVFTDYDNLRPDGHRDVAIVSARLAARVWPNADPIGKRINCDDDGAGCAEIVGIVGDVRHNSLTDGVGYDLYYPCYQSYSKQTHFVARTQGDPMTLANDIQRAIWQVAPDTGVFNVMPVTMLSANTVWQSRLWGLLFGIFSGIALVMAAAGIYGVMAYFVTQRTREIGVRIALGAQWRDVLRLIMSSGMSLVAVGLTIGLAGALALTRLMTSLLFEVSPTDPITFGVVALCMVLAALLACYIPARRATKVDPLIALRYE
ncbi:MAG TPA: ABC transporter permease [Pyrinomonadaceae bacterium]|jgi:putative ABC transport system permease protein|nr:ABC transporter permease [Pyrinomonadaceae bacterium]